MPFGKAAKARSLSIDVLVSDAVFEQFAGQSNVRGISKRDCEGDHRPKAAFAVEEPPGTTKSSGNAK